MTFSYELTWWNEFEGEHGASEDIKGFIVAKNYFEALKKLLHQYGETETECFSLGYFAPDDMLEFREGKGALWDYVKNELKEDIMW